MSLAYKYFVFLELSCEQDIFTSLEGRQMFLQGIIKRTPTFLSHLILMVRAVARTLIGGGGGAYSYIHVLPDEFLFKSNSNPSI